MLFGTLKIRSALKVSFSFDYPEPVSSATVLCARNHRKRTVQSYPKIRILPLPSLPTNGGIALPLLKNVGAKFFSESIQRVSQNWKKELVLVGLEPTTLGLLDPRSSQLSYKTA